MNAVTIDVADRLERIEEMLVMLLKQKIVKQAYSTTEFAQLTGKAEFTIREHCRNSRLHATKINGRGESGEWRISHEELIRFQNEGLLPIQRLRR